MRSSPTHCEPPGREAAPEEESDYELFRRLSSFRTLPTTFPVTLIDNDRLPGIEDYHIPGWANSKSLLELLKSGSRMVYEVYDGGHG